MIVGNIVDHDVQLGILVNSPSPVSAIQVAANIVKGGLDHAAESTVIHGRHKPKRVRRWPFKRQREIVK